MLELEHGVVTHFDGRHGKEFGFLEVINPDGSKTSEKLFFHFNDGQFVEIVAEENDIEFVGTVFPGNDLPLWRMGNPPVGMKLAFKRAPGNDGREKASPWTYAEAYDKRVQALFEPHYRVVKVTKLGYSGFGDTSEAIWEGRGADKLSRDFDVRIRGDILDDPLADTVDFVAGSTTRYLFERWDIAAGIYGVSDPQGGQRGSWNKCHDPRVLSERAQKLMAAQSA